MLNFRKITSADEEAYRAFEATMLEDKKINPFVELEYVEDFEEIVARNAQSEIQQGDKAGQHSPSITPFWMRK